MTECDSNINPGMYIPSVGSNSSLDTSSVWMAELQSSCQNILQKSFLSGNAKLMDLHLRIQVKTLSENQELRDVDYKVQV
jgi:hypothetical protein